MKTGRDGTPATEKVLSSWPERWAKLRALPANPHVQQLARRAAEVQEKVTTAHLQKAVILGTVPALLLPAAASAEAVLPVSQTSHVRELNDLFRGCMPPDVRHPNRGTLELGGISASPASLHVATSLPLGSLCGPRLQSLTNELAKDHLGRTATAAELRRGDEALSCSPTFDLAVENQRQHFAQLRADSAKKQITALFSAELGRAPTAKELAEKLGHIAPPPALVEPFMPSVLQQLQSLPEWRLHLVVTQLTRFGGHPVAGNSADTRALLAQTEKLAAAGVPPAELNLKVAELANHRMNFPLQAEELAQSLPKLSPETIDAYYPALREAMLEFDIVTLVRIEAFLAQISHETFGLTALSEFADGSAYEGRKDLGNVHPGDGVRYKGRGALMLTGRANYRLVGQALGLDLEGNPELAASPAVSFRIAGLFWKTRGLNELADKGDFEKITRRINGGTNGLEDRLRRWAHIQQVVS